MKTKYDKEEQYDGICEYDLSMEKPAVHTFLSITKINLC